MKFEHTETWGFEGAIRGMRNPLGSWAKSDTIFDEYGYPILGEKDLDLMQRLIKAGSEHRKFLRYIHVQVDITAPMYFWSEFDTYKIGTAANSTSKMHKLASTPITLDCFETDDLNEEIITEATSNLDPYYDCSEVIINICEKLRQKYLETKDKRYWKELIRWLPESWLQTRTVDLNYEVLRNIYHQRKSHKLTEWSESFINWINTLLYSEELILFDNN